MPGPKSTFLVCPNCGGDLNHTSDSRPGNFKGLPVIRRRKKCDDCGEKRTTYELTAPDLDRLHSQAIAKLTSDPRVRDVIAQIALERGIV